ncbi:hypothetical protein BKA65DRAFT_26175 [Rhexocercosporidium sp. MPI-PUGE-AT-0058]|nr:hypothetical protein BKA65DRAFT_26175 [Rhexocercosporidium sp. MPI-PUGE-AT-0058]
MEGFGIYAFHCSGALANLVSLEAFIMLTAIKNEEKSTVEFLLQNLANFRNSLANSTNITDVLSLSRHVANKFLQTPLGPQICFDRELGFQMVPGGDIESNIPVTKHRKLGGSQLCWRYRLIKAPANCLKGPWINILMEEGVDFHTSTERGPPLHSAAAAGDLCALNALIIAGVDINASDGSVTAISQAALNGQLGAIQLLHDQGANLVAGDTYSTFFDCVLSDQATARFCIDLPRFQINGPCGNSLSKECAVMTPIKVLISHYQPEIWATRMLCEAAAELNEPGIISFVHKYPIWGSFEKPEGQYKPHQSVLDRALERVAEAKSEKVRQVTEEEFKDEKEWRSFWNQQGEDQCGDSSSYNKWLCQIKEQRVWVAEEVVRILQEFGAKLGRKLPGDEYMESPDFQHSAGLKRRRSGSQ